MQQPDLSGAPFAMAEAAAKVSAKRSGETAAGYRGCVRVDSGRQRGWEPAGYERAPQETSLGGGGDAPGAGACRRVAQLRPFARANLPKLKSPSFCRGRAGQDQLQRYSARDFAGWCCTLAFRRHLVQKAARRSGLQADEFSRSACAGSWNRRRRCAHLSGRRTDALSASLVRSCVQLKKIDVAGGPAQTLCPVSGGAPLGAWSPAGINVVSPRHGRPHASVGGRRHVHARYQARFQTRRTAPYGFPRFCRMAGTSCTCASLRRTKMKRSVYRVAGFQTRGTEFAANPFRRCYSGQIRRLGGLIPRLSVVPARGRAVGPAVQCQQLEPHGRCLFPSRSRWAPEPAWMKSMFTASANGTLVYRAGQSGGRELTWH